MRQALCLLLAKYAGQEITRELGIRMVQDLFPDRTIDPTRFTPIEHGPYVIAAEHFADILPELAPLHELHWQETEGHRHGLKLNVRHDHMADRMLAGAGLQLTIRCAGELVGHLRLWIFRSDHTDTTVAEEDTLYIRPDHRGGFLVMALLRYAERCLWQLHPGIEIRTNSKMVNKADVLMKRMKYQPVAIQHVKFLKESP